jgi:hypothetical protein
MILNIKKMAIGVMQLCIFLMDILNPRHIFKRGRLLGSEFATGHCILEELKIHRQTAGGTCPQFLLPLSMYLLDHI